jgi:type I restriction enzyme M protein
LKDESLEDSANLPDPDALALEIAEELEAALEQFAAIAEDLKPSVPPLALADRIYDRKS